MFCEPELPECEALAGAGYVVTAGRAPPGQGTANRCVFFGAQYLELIELASREDAAANPVRLDRRTD